MAVTPVRTGPLPISSLPSLEMSVVWPTSTPLTSVMALLGPGVPSKGTPRSRARGLAWADRLVARAMVRINTVRRTCDGDMRASGEGEVYKDGKGRRLRALVRPGRQSAAVQSQQCRTFVGQRDYGFTEKSGGARFHRRGSRFVFEEEIPSR